MLDRSGDTRPGVPTPAELSSMAASMFWRGHVVVRALQRWRPYVCPFDQLLEHVPVGSSVLDVGCGGGLFLALLHRVGRLGRGVGFDARAHEIEVARKMADDLEANGGGGQLLFYQCDVGDPWPAGQFDVVSLVDVVHHVPPRAQRAVLVTAAARVSPGGRLLYKDMCARPRWRALANRAHDLLIARQWIHYVPISSVEAWAKACELELVYSARINRLCYGHDLLVFERPSG